MKSSVILYKTLVLPIIDYSVAAITNSIEKSLRSIESLERACLIHASKLLPQTDSNVLNLNKCHTN